MVLEERVMEKKRSMGKIWEFSGRISMGKEDCSERLSDPVEGRFLWEVNYMVNISTEVTIIFLTIRERPMCTIKMYDKMYYERELV